MSHEQESSEFGNLFNSIDDFLKQAKDEPKENKSPQAWPVQPSEQVGYEIPAHAIEDILTLQKDLLSYFDNRGPYSMGPEEVEIDNMEKLKQRIYTENTRPFSVEFPITPRYLEFLHFPDPDNSPFAQTLNRSLQNQLNLGIHADFDTSGEAMNLNTQKGFPQRFDPMTTYVIDDKRGEMIKVCKLPHEFGDDRTDVMPDDPSAQYVLAEIRPIDVIVMNSYLSELRHKLLE